MPILHYGFGIIQWTQAELHGLDWNMRELLVKSGFYHPKSDIHKLYFWRNDGDRGLIGVFVYLRQEMTALGTYFETTEEGYLVNIAKEEESRLKQKIILFLKEEKGGTVVKINEEHILGLDNMKTHGQLYGPAKNTIFP